MTTALKRVSARQGLLHAYIDVVLANHATGVALAIMELPAGAVVLSGHIKPTTVFNSTTSDALSIGDSGSATRYKSGADLQALTIVALVPTGYVTTAPTQLLATWTSGGGVPTTGAYTVHVTYMVRGRNTSNQGLDSAV